MSDWMNAFLYGISIGLLTALFIFNVAFQITKRKRKRKLDVLRVRECPKCGGFHEYKLDTAQSQTIPFKRTFACPVDDSTYTISVYAVEDSML